MRKIKFPLVIILFTSTLFYCQLNKPPRENYVKLEFIRNGGGNKEFTISKPPGAGSLKIDLSKFSFRDTSLSISIPQSRTNKELIRTINSLFGGKVQFRGKFKQSTRPTGTWSYFYIYSKEGSKYEITDETLRKKLSPLESIVNQEMQRRK